MKFLCLDCDDVMAFAERQIPGDGTLAAVFTCGSCGREMAMLTNPMETQLVSSMGVKIGGREVPAQPMELARTSLEGGRDDAFVSSEDIPLASGDTATPGEGGGAGEAAVGRVEHPALRGVVRLVRRAGGVEARPDHTKVGVVA